MGARFASEKRALGVCDRCGFTYKLKELNHETVKGNRIATRVCPECYDPDHPQLFVGQYPVYDPQSLRDPRPDSSEIASSRGLTVVIKPVRAFARVGEFTAS